MINKVKFWCHKVLPLVYDDSLSYYEVLCKVVKKLNDVIEVTNSIPEEIKEIIYEYLQSEEFKEELNKLVNISIINAKFPPTGLTAPIGDGVTNDTEAIQALINYAKNNNKILYIPEGKYLVSELTANDINIVGNKAIIAQGSSEEGCTFTLGNNTKINGIVVELYSSNGKGFNITGNNNDLYNVNIDAKTIGDSIGISASGNNNSFFGNNTATTKFTGTLNYINKLSDTYYLSKAIFEDTIDVNKKATFNDEAEFNEFIRYNKIPERISDAFKSIPIIAGDGVEYGVLLKGDDIDIEVKGIHIIKGTTYSEINSEIENYCSDNLILFKKQTYELAGTLNIPDGANVDFNGAEIKRVNNVHDVMILGSNVHVKNCKINGNALADNLTNNNPLHRFNSVLIDEQENVTISNFELWESVNGEIQTEGVKGSITILHSNNVKIFDCYIHDNCGTGIFGYGTTDDTNDTTNTIINNCIFENNSGSGISGGFKYLTVSNCIALNNGKEIAGQFSGNFTGISLNGYKIVCTNCISNKNTGAGFTLAHNNTDRYISLSNCYAEENNLDGVWVNCDESTIDNCIFVNNVRRSIYINSECSVNISNCVSDGSVGCYFQNKTSISNCLFMNASSGENVFGTVRITSCRFRNDANTAQYGVIIANTNSKLIISDCLFETESGYYQGRAIMCVNNSVVYANNIYGKGFTNLLFAASGGKFYLNNYDADALNLTSGNISIIASKNGAVASMYIHAGSTGSIQIDTNNYIPVSSVVTPTGISISLSGEITISEVGDYYFNYITAAGYNKSQL